MSFQSKISPLDLGGHWLIDKAYIPQLMRILAGELPAGINLAEQSKDISPVLHHQASAGRSVFLATPWTDISDIADGSVVMINIFGPVMKFDAWYSKGMASIAQMVIRIGNADNIAGLIVNYDTPGGQVHGTTLLADAIKSVDAKKPVLSLVDDGIAASAGMWLASAGREIYVTKKTSKVGSIGVYTTIADINKHYEDFWKLKVTDVYAPQSEDKNKIYLDALKGDEEELKADLQVLAQEFIETISTNRGNRLKGDSWNTGKMFYAKEALKIGLIDGIKSFEQVVDRMNTLISSTTTNTKNPSRNMANENHAPVVAFKRTLAAAKAEAFAVTDEGFVATEEQLNEVEKALEASEVTAKELETANAAVTEHTATIATQKTTITTQTERIKTLEAEVAELGEKASGDGTVTDTKGDVVEDNKKVRSYNDPNSQFNKLAASRGL